MNCSFCDNSKALKKKKTTHRYKESGLQNVTLLGVDQFHCEQCGENYIGFGDIDFLHQTLAHLLVRKKSLLSGTEVRFLRKHLGYSGVFFAKIIGYEAATLSRLESGSQPVTRAFDRLIRFTLLSKFPDRNYDLHDQLLRDEGLSLHKIELTPLAEGRWKIKAA